MNQPSLDEVIGRFLMAVEAGQQPERERLLADYPHLADQLREFLDDYFRIEGIVAPTPESEQNVPAATSVWHQLSIDNRERLRKFLVAAAEKTKVEEMRPRHTAVAAHSQASDSVGPYKLLQKIGTGGMGEVWMAEQERPVRRRVALKLIKAGIDSKQIVARFEAERQALAMMNHQNIAKVLDAGTNDHGSPYFVMELVQGIPITKYCDQYNLTISERLNLFVPVCEALQHAHQKGIIHRDLKPSNILVTLYDGHAVPKVIDFGLAKALQHQSKLTDKTLFTEFGQVVGTLQYMSPEQAEMNALDIDTRTDVYSLGVLLYEILTGSTPIERDALEEQAVLKVLETIRETDPPRPSIRLSSSGEKIADIGKHRQIDPRKLSQILRGELDWIVMKALEKDRTRRYATASGLAEEIGRYVAGDPIEARPPSAAYRMQKYVRKNRGVVVSVLAIASLLVVASVVSTTFGIAASIASGKAKTSEQKAVTEKNLADQAREKAEVERNRAEQREREIARFRSALIQERAQRLVRIGKADQAYRLISEQREAHASDTKPTWEGRYLHNELQRATLVNRWTQGSVSCVTIDHESGRILTGDSMGVVRILSASNGRLIDAFPAHRQRVAGIGMTGNGDALITAGDDGLVKSWSIQGKPLQSIQCHIDVLFSFAIHPEKSLAVTAGKDGVICITNPISGELLKIVQLDNQVAQHVRFHPAGKQLIASTKSGRTVVWDLAWKDVGSTPELQEIANLSVPDNASRRSPEVLAVAFDKDGTQLVTAHTDNMIRLWDMRQYTLLDEFPTEASGKVASLMFDPTTDDLIVGGSDAAIAFFNTLRNPQSRLLGHSAPISAIAATADGTLVSADSGGELRIWQRDQRQTTLDVQAHLLNVVDLAFSSDGKRLISASYDHDGKIIESQTGKILHTLGKHHAEFSPPSNGRFPGTIRSIQTVVGQGQENILTCCGISLDGKTVATGGMDKSVWLWNTESGESMGILKHPAEITSLCFDPSNSQRLSTASWDDHVRVWDLTTQAVAVDFIASDTEHINQIVFSPDGHTLATAHGDGVIGLWDSSSGENFHLLQSHAGTVECVAFDATGGQMTSGGDDRTIRLWQETDDNGWQNVREFVGHTGAVNSVNFSPDGTRLVSASQSSNDKSIRIWDIEIGFETLILDGQRVAVFSPDGHQLAVVGLGRSGLIRIMNTSEFFPESNSVEIDEVPSQLPKTADLRLLGSFSASRVAGREEPHDSAPERKWLCVVLSLPNERLMLDVKAFGQWRQRQQENGRVPIENRLRLKVLSRDNFSLVIPDAEPLAARLVSGNWPEVDFVEQDIFHTRTINFRPEERQSIVLAWQIPEETPLHNLSIQFQQDDPVALPTLRLNPPAKTLIPPMNLGEHTDEGRE